MIEALVRAVWRPSPATPTRCASAAAPEGDRPPVRGETAEARFRIGCRGQASLVATVRVHGEQLTSSRHDEPVVKTMRVPSGDHPGSVSRGRIVGQAHEPAPVEVHQVDIGVAVDRPFEGDLARERDRGEARRRRCRRGGVDEADGEGTGPPPTD